jgi:hypothetical protein
MDHTVDRTAGATRRGIREEPPDRRIYALDPGPLREVDGWLANFRTFWGEALDDLADDVARGSGEG